MGSKEDKNEKGQCQKKGVIPKNGTRGGKQGKKKLATKKKPHKGKDDDKSKKWKKEGK